MVDDEVCSITQTTKLHCWKGTCCPHTTINEMLNRGFLQEFETIAWNEAGSKMHIDFKHIIHNYQSANSD